MEQLLDNATEILILIFLIIVFLQSGIDKVFDWKGNLSWLKEHFLVHSYHVNWFVP